MVRKELQENGVQLATPKGMMDFDSPEQRLHQDMLAAIAGYKRHKIRERTGRGIHRPRTQNPPWPRAAGSPWPRGRITPEHRLTPP